MDAYINELRQILASLGLTSSDMLIALAGAMVGGYITYLGAIKLQQKASWQVSKDAFREAFLPTLMRMELKNYTCPHEPLSDSGGSHLLAYYRFKNSVPRWKRKQFESAWKDYYGPIDVPCRERFPNQYRDHSKDEKRCQEINELIIKKLRHLLKFTE